MARKIDRALIGGPYYPPPSRIGQVLICRRYGPVIVTGYSASLAWPQHTVHGRQWPILCGDLERAIRTEAAATVAAWWEVRYWIVVRWRRMLGAANTPGTRRLRALNNFTADEAARGHVARGTEAQRRLTARHTRELWARRGGLGGKRAWTAAEIALLGTDADAAIAARLGRSPSAAEAKRRKLGIASALAGDGIRVRCSVCGRQFLARRRGQGRARALCSMACRRREKILCLRARRARETLAAARKTLARRSETYP